MVFLALEMPVFGVFSAQRAIVCSHGLTPNGMKLRISIRGNGYMEIHGIYMGSFVSWSVCYQNHRKKEPTYESNELIHTVQASGP